jgi:hypothetical protein
MSGGRVIVPLFDTGMLVMLQCCNAATRLSSCKPEQQTERGGSTLPANQAILRVFQTKNHQHSGSFTPIGGKLFRHHQSNSSSCV